MTETGLTPRGRIDPERLDRDRYAETLTAEAIRCGLLTDADEDRIRTELLKVLGEVIGYRTEGRSTNVGIDVAKELSESILFNIGTALRAAPTPDEAALLLKERRMSDLYADGYLINRGLWEEAKRLWGRVRYTRKADAGRDYDLAVDRNLRNYLEQYDPRTGAHGKLFLVLPELGIRGAFHIRGTVSVLKKMLAFNEGKKPDIVYGAGSEGPNS